MIFRKEAERIREEVRQQLFRVSEQRRAAEALYRRACEDEDTLERILGLCTSIEGLRDDACPHCYIWLGENVPLVYVDGKDLQLRYICQTCRRGFDRRSAPRHEAAPQPEAEQTLVAAGS